MQHPTCTRLRVRYSGLPWGCLPTRSLISFDRSPQDAQVIFHAVALGVLPMVTRRLDAEERRAISSGNVYVWEERGPNPEATGVSRPLLALPLPIGSHPTNTQLGIERWTDGKRLVAFHAPMAHVD